ncbi:bacteriocin immunity protein [Pantoea agglomerans]|uniref:bacteriocin immunity protein n=1 Tax=Enterobacter agglomerans TaxID=549 RepID=UPI00289914D4|nr:bacteriocin immunity protein [Pantoea agglomerans]WNK37624.1 bacteriocin immunity protein [Pantoea agglomerans]WNK55800.1 bacteriocin immunity protein [Pantoea agglomerans]
MKLKSRFQDYTVAEFTELVAQIFSVDGGENYQDELLENFIIVSDHPKSSDLIYYNDDEDLTAEKVVAKVREWRKSQGLSDLRA